MDRTLWICIGLALVGALLTTKNLYSKKEDQNDDENTNDSEDIKE